MNKKKLTLSKETLALLTDQNLTGVVGGEIGRTFNCPTNESCTGLCRCKPPI